MIKKGLGKLGKSQRWLAERLGITESAVSQYLSEKRGSELKFNKNEMIQIIKTAKKIVSDNKNSRKYLFELTKELMGSDNICKLHRKNDPSIEKNCKICMGN